jgi:hypothetical protein
MRRSLVVLVDGMVFRLNRDANRLEYYRVSCVDRVFREYMPYRWGVYDDDAWNTPEQYEDRPMPIGATDICRF